jgi:hypothetical protein
MGLGVVEWVSMGSLPTAVAHTRPVPILATSSREGLLRGDEQKGPAGLLRVPSAALSTLELAITETGVPTVGFYAQLPHYVNGPYAAGTAALLEHVGRHLGVDLPLGDLVEAAAAQRRRLDAAVAADDESRAYVARLEEIAGEEQRIPSGDEIAGEIERFLQQRPARSATRDGRGATAQQHRRHADTRHSADRTHAGPPAPGARRVRPRDDRCGPGRGALLPSRIHR